MSALDSEERTIWIVDAHRGDGKGFVVRADDPGQAFRVFCSTTALGIGSNMKMYLKFISLFVALVASMQIAFASPSPPQTQPDVIRMQTQGHLLVVSPQVICVTYSDNGPDSPVAFLRGVGPTMPIRQSDFANIQQRYSADWVIAKKRVESRAEGRALRSLLAEC